MKTAAINFYFRKVKMMFYNQPPFRFSLPEIYSGFYGEDGKKLHEPARAAASGYSSVDRNILVTALLRQNEFLNNKKVNENIRLLSSPDTFTVCTGHQLCLFGGPLFFAYKIITVIKLSRELSEQLPGKKIIPVFWMATEDHDLPEIISFHLFGKKYEWNTTQTGAVGRMETTGITELLREVKQVKGNAPFADEFISACEKAYAPGNNLARATRIFVNELFGESGLVCVDGDDSDLKKLFIPLMKHEMEEQMVFRAMNEKNKSLLQSGIKPQAQAREYNLFYLSANKREGMVTDKENFSLQNGNKKWSREELLKEITNFPERFSPNVLMRPLYQQLILPNIANVGGPGELAYWIQLPELFSSLNIPFPALFPRISGVMAEEVQLEKINKLGLTINDFVQPVDDIVKQFIGGKEENFYLDEVKKKWENEFSSLAELIKKEDASLEGTVNAEGKKMQKFLETLEAKIAKTKKQKHEQEITQIKKIKEKFYPGGEMQERSDTVMEWYWKYGKEILNIIGDIKL
ncbi:MAG: bacillithiol biosynthesis cysteine-adding enzyme BshC [Bacteroidota bacterium]